MILAALVLLPFFGGLLCYFLSLRNTEIARALAASTIALNLLLTILAWMLADKREGVLWIVEFNQPWIPAIGASFHLGLDGLSFVLVLLANAISFIAMVNMSEIPKRHEGLFLFLLLTTVSGVLGVLLSIDLLLFFLFWEVMLVPLYFLILLFGEDQRQKAATRFLILTQASGLFLLLSIVMLFVAQAGEKSFAFDSLVNLELPLSTQRFVAAGFMFAFLVKLPTLPFHFWMPSIFATAPISALMAGILVKTSIYGFMRFSKFSIPLFPDVIDEIAPYIMVLGVVSMIYGALLAYSQTDIKKILAYSTISHVGLILAGVFSQNSTALNGVAVLLVTQAISTSGLLMICNHVLASTRSRDISRMSGLFNSMPNAGAVTMILVMAAIGLPGLGNFIGEWLLLLGLFQSNVWVGAVGCVGVVLSALYMLRFLHAIFFGKADETQTHRDIPAKSLVLHTVMLCILVAIGFYPAPLIDIVSDTWQPDESESLGQDL